MLSATTAAALSLHLPVRQEWLDRRREEIIEPDLPIVDPHAFKRIAAGCSAAEKRALFSGTATKFYRLGEQLA
jgi:hypothetical protein